MERKELTGTLNHAQTKELFESNAVLIGRTDGVPRHRVVELFGENAAEFGAGKPGNGYNGYGIGDFTLWYLNYKGFQMAATYYNIKQIRERGDIE